MKKTTNVVVHKANIPLIKGESINSFTDALNTAGRVHIKESLNISKGGGGWMVESDATKAVFNVYGNDIDKYYAVKYTRDKKTGAFSFQQPMEVKRVTKFVPVPTTAVPKTVSGGIFITKSGAEKPGFWEYAETEKSLWNGII